MLSPWTTNAHGIGLVVSSDSIFKIIEKWGYEMVFHVPNDKDFNVIRWCFMGLMIKITTPKILIVFMK